MTGASLRAVPARLVVLVSGGGTNLQALLDACADPGFGATVVAVGADRDGIEGLARAERAGVPTFVERVRDHDSREGWDQALTKACLEHAPDLVVLAGFMKLVGPAFLGELGGRCVNTHPALSPSFPGMQGPADALAYGVKVTGATLFVVDATVGITDADEAVVRILRKSGKPVILAANKVDDQRAEAEAAGLWNLGLGEPYPVSALHGRGSGDMLDAILAALPETPQQSFEEVGGPRRIAIVGKPNVGKSSLLNMLAKEDRVVVDNAAGTTVDPVDELITLGDTTWRFIDTAGIRKRVKEASGHEYYASLRTTTAIDRAEVAVLVLDASQSISEQDQRIVQTIREAGRALVLDYAQTIERADTLGLFVVGLEGATAP